MEPIADLAHVTRAEEADVLARDLEDGEPDGLVEVIERDALGAAVEFAGDFFLAVKHRISSFRYIPWAEKRN